MLSCCFYSSFLFLMNSGLACIHKYYLYSSLFMVLFASSILFHYNTNIYTMLIDKISIFFIVIYGGYVFIQKCIIYDHNFPKFIIILFIVSTFLITIYLYYYGFLHKKYCYHLDTTIANLYHSFLHLISFIGHSLIITM